MAKRIPKNGLRRGVLLLLVLSLLALFGLLAISFVMITGQAKRGTEAMSRAEQTADPPAEVFNEAIGQVIRGPNNNVSVLGPHNLLEDVYGNSTAFGQVQAVAPIVSGFGQIVNVTFNAQLYSDEALTNVMTPNEPLRRIGTLLTVTTPTSPAAFKSYRIVGYSAANGFQLLVEQVAPQQNDRFEVNGAPFGGTGFGFDTSSGQIGDAALQPKNSANWTTSGGANEDYDAPDYQNMLLALMLPNGQVPIPSLHRPELVNYWRNRVGISDWNNNTGNIQDLVVMRPLTLRHPGFPSIDLVNGPWDVDNDGDGTPDSIWVDLGLAPRTSKDGRIYKPLVAILCLDMDGRVNLNAHGSSAQLASEYDQTVSAYYAGTGDPSSPTAISIPRGAGYGPGEIRLDRVITDADQVRQLLRGYVPPTGSSDLAVEGRYGEIGTTAFPYPQAGTTGSTDALMSIKYFEYPGNYLNDLTSFASPPDLWGRAAIGLDYSGQPLFIRPTTFTSIPPGGSAPQTQTVDWYEGEVQNPPYSLNLSRQQPRPGGGYTSTGDNPFTPGELEIVLRRFDFDAARLPRRLVSLAPSLLNPSGGVPDPRTEVTTDSYDIACLPGSLRGTSDVRGSTDVAGSFNDFGGSSKGRAKSFADLLRAKLAANSITGTAADNQIQIMLSWDLLLNRRMDVNRPFGNGRDDNSSGTVDESGDAGATGEAAWNNLFPNVAGTVSFHPANGLSLSNQDWNGDGTVDAKDQQLCARHLFARHLYVLAMLLSDAGNTSNRFSFPTPDETGLTAAQRQELTARRIAQWAVNVVDFRDSDGIMTPFEYDVDPFNGWNVDGIVGTADDSQPDRRLVWGCEESELLLTETLAFHDRRVADTTYDSTHHKRTDDANNDNVPDDPDLDQPLIPQGSAFFEVYCPRNPNNKMPRELYTQVGGQWCLDLDKRSPASGTTPQYPVWRMVISESRQASTDNNVYDRAIAAPCSTSFEPRQQRSPNIDGPGFSLLNGTPPAAIQIDRIVWFAPMAPTTNHGDYQRVYYNRNLANPAVPCGGYAVVGPRFTTAIGGTSDLGAPSPQTIALDTVKVTNYDGATTYPDTTSTIKKPVGIVAAHDPPSDWVNHSPAADLGDSISGEPRYGIGISISEPIPGVGSYYPEPPRQNARNGNRQEAYVDVETGANAQPQLDHPLEYVTNPTSLPPCTMPLATDNLLRTQTTLNCKTVFLQRIADPTRPYQPDPSAIGYNPYVTVDWSPIDLTVFNGSDRLPSATVPGGGQWDPDDNNPNATTDVRFASRQRGGSTYTAGSSPWTWSTEDPATTVNQTSSSSTPPNFRHNLGWTTTAAPVSTDANAVFGQTLGYVNRGYGTPWSTTDSPAAPTAYVGIPREPTTVHPLPFPWLTWNNRPFVSPLELLFVPSSSPGRLSWEFSVARSGNPYEPPATGNYTQLWPFSHLPNFFHSGTDGVSPAFYTMLDFLEVPSRFVGSELVLNPQFAGQTDPATLFHRPPFNTISYFRDPGRVNINTIASTRVWEALLNGRTTPTFDALVQSRRGYGGTTNLEEMDVNYPTRFANPFRSSSCSDLVPTSVPALLKSRPVNVTLLRASGISPDTTATPLFADAFTTSPDDDYRNTDRNAFFRYQGLQRLQNLVTMRSNVYAVWMTVGYFEASWVGVSAGIPDGYQLGRELGSDTGDIKRHRAFYIIDRSIPVGFSRGKDYNTKDTILLSRMIE